MSATVRRRRLRRLLRRPLFVSRRLFLSIRDIWEATGHPSARSDGNDLDTIAVLNPHADCFADPYCRPKPIPQPGAALDSGRAVQVGSSAHRGLDRASAPWQIDFDDGAVGREKVGMGARDVHESLAVLSPLDCDDVGRNRHCLCAVSRQTVGMSFFGVAACFLRWSGEPRTPPSFSATSRKASRGRDGLSIFMPCNPHRIRTPLAVVRRGVE